MASYYCFGEIAVILGGEVYSSRKSTRFEIGDMNSSPVIFPLQGTVIMWFNLSKSWFPLPSSKR